MKLLIVDTETTGLTPTTANLIEVGVVVYDVETSTALQQISTLIPFDDNPQFALNGISWEASKKINYAQWNQALDFMGLLAEHCDYLIAHNAQFDKLWCDSIYLFPAKQWICSYKDIDWNPHKATDLARLALAHNVPVVDTHRALTDCRLLSEIFRRRDDLAELIQDAVASKILVEAVVSYADQGLAKGAGFTWDRSKKKWLKSIKPELMDSFDFRCVAVAV